MHTHVVSKIKYSLSALALLLGATACFAASDHPEAAQAPAHCGQSAGDFGLDFQTKSCAGLINYESASQTQLTKKRLTALIQQSESTASRTFYLEMFPQSKATLHEKILPELQTALYAPADRPLSTFDSATNRTTWRFRAGHTITFEHNSW